MRKLLLAGIIGMWVTGAAAHSPLQKTTPTNGAIVSEIPAELVLDFKGKIRLTRVSLTREGDPAINLDLSGLKGFLSDYSLPIEPMGSGDYVIKWRGLGSDGHAMNGTFGFTVE